MLILIILALAPAVLLGFYIYKKDRAEKEPARLLIALVGAGAAVTIGAVILEIVFGGLLNLAYGLEFMEEKPSEALALGSFDVFPSVIYHFIEYFLVVAVAEEGLKWLLTFKITSKNKNFNSLFDGVIYCVFTSLGFAALENVEYVLIYGAGNAVARAITAVPGHMFFGVIMGYFYSTWHLQYQAKHLESECVRLNYMKQPTDSAFNTRTPLIKSIVLPIAVHGFYDFCLGLSDYARIIGTGPALTVSVCFVVLFYLVLIALYIYCFRLVKMQSKADTFTGRLALGMVIQKYPELTQTLPQETINYVMGVQPLQVNTYAQPNSYAQTQTDAYTQTRSPYAQPNSYSQTQPNPYSQTQPNPYSSPEK